MRFKFTPWPELTVEKDQALIDRWLFLYGAAVKQRFIKGLTGPHSGIHYPRMPNRSSAPGEFPATQSGRLLGGTKQETRANEVEVGSTAAHARFLRGTKRMAPRKMFAEAMQETPKPPVGRFARFRKV